MSTVSTKRPLRQAIADAEAFQELFAGCYESWTIAGSIRRQKFEVGDCDHVVIPKFGDVPGPNLFSLPERVNLLWHRADELVADGTIQKHVVKGKCRWGDRQRSIDWRDFNNEIWTTTPNSLGSALTIRTGPSNFSAYQVSRLLGRNMRNHLGDVWSCEPCPNALEQRCEKSCEFCDGTQLKCVERLIVPDEETFFGLCGQVWVEPRRRN